MSVNCPFCLQDNSCTVNSESCWCQQQTVPESLIQLLPSSAINKACICISCIKRFQDDPVAFKAAMHGKTQ